LESLEEWLTQPEGLAARLRALRVQAGLSGKALADANSWAQSKVSRIETGQQLPSPEDIRAWARTCAADDEIVRELLGQVQEARIAHATFRGRMRRGQAQVQKSYSDLAAGASLIRHFETVYVPGPLQIPAYARRVLTEMIPLHGLEIDDVDAAVHERMARAQMLYEPSKRWEFLLAEPVLRWLLPGPAVMRAQLDRLQSVIGLERIRFGIVPMGVELATTPQNTVEVYVGSETVAVAETYIGETWHRDDEAAAYNRAIDRQWEDAVEGDAARQLIAAAIAQLRERYPEGAMTDGGRA
jgi:transcriptional regulator with XRE-family HTH domain